MAKLRTISRWLVVALVALVMALILLHQLLAGRAPIHTPGPLPTALAPHAAIAASALARPVDAHLAPLAAAIRV
jgi:hypothetical protein